MIGLTRPRAASPVCYRQDGQRNRSGLTAPGPKSHVLHLSTAGSMIAQQLLNALVVGSVYALFALGFTLIFGVHHILNMAHGAVFMWGAFFGLFAITRFDLPFPL